jgi:formate hydrogenlyase subunit 3/multisubunit Na+/H+ antiporter MnhD subunit
MPLLVLLPLVGAIAAFSLPSWGRRIGGGAVLLTLALAVWAALHVLLQGPLTGYVGGWAVPLGIRLRVDGLSAILLLLLATVGLLISIYSMQAFSSARGAAGRTARYYWPLWLFLLAALNGMFLSADLFNLYVTLELSGLSAVALVALAGTRTALDSALRYLFVSLSGSLLYLMGVALLYGACGTLDIELLAGRVHGPPGWTALALMTAGLMMKGALFPLHFWLPPAHSSAPAPVSAALSALVVKGSLYILLRLWFEIVGGGLTHGALQLLGACGAAAILWGSLQALVQERLKLLVAYSTVAQLGYLYLFFPLAGGGGVQVWTGGLIYLTAHAFAKAAMFLAAGNIIKAAGHDRISELGGITRVLPVSVFAIGLAGISLVGLPPSAGFVGKWLLLGAGLQQGQWWWVVTIIGGSMLSAAYMVRLLSHAFIRDGAAASWKGVPPGLEWSAIALAVTAFLLGFASTFFQYLLRGLAWIGGAL